MDKIRHTSEWKLFSELRPVQQNISSLGYNKEYIEEHKMIIPDLSMLAG